MKISVTTILNAVIGVFGVLLSAANLAQDLDLAQEPLFLAASADPNIMFIIDDSGSMMFEVTPDDIAMPVGGSTGAAFVFPRADNVYGSEDYSLTQLQVATVDDSGDYAAYAAMTRSPQLNASYYNPAVTYEPWTRHDNSLYPPATPSCAKHNPEISGSCPGSSQSVNGNARNLTKVNGRYNNNRWYQCKSTRWGISCDTTTDSKSFWPASYYWYDGGSVWSSGSFTKVEIRSSQSVYSGHGRTSRTDCANASNGQCTYAEEIQNFANWYTYYRSRILASRAGIGKAFAAQGDSMRVGFGAINKGASKVDGVTTGTVMQGVRPFEGESRNGFFDLLYGSDIPRAGTPLRKALDDVGQYFSRADNAGPWGRMPGQNDNTPHLQCRRSYSVLMTDGYWTDGTDHQASTSGARADNDDDGETNTLADIASYYWENDLRSNLSDAVPYSESNPATWQHMVTFGVGLGVFGAVDPDTAFADPASVDWPDPHGSSKTEEKIDDLLHAAVNSYGGFFSASQPEVFAQNLAGVLDSIVERESGSASSLAANSTRLGTDTALFQARFDTTKWSGEIRAWQLDEDDGSLIEPVKWTTKGKIDPTEHASRRVFTYNGTSALEFKESSWNSLSTAQRNALKGDGDDALGKKRINWVRGQNNIAGLRVRDEILGDIVNSSPVFSGRRSFNFERLKEAAGADSYEAFVQTRKNRKEVIYVGANDGMVHAFEADTGEELFAYVPSGVYDQLRKLSQPDYGRSSNPHVYSVDGPLFVGDAYYNGRWRTLLVGGLGAGGRGLFVLDVTNPTTFSTGDVLFELTADDMVWGDQLGSVMAKPIIAPMANGNWAIVFGNGYNSASGKASLFVVELSPSSGAFNVVTLSPSNDQLNGLAEPALLTHGGGLVTTAYAGDLHGNMWKFDLSSSSTTNQWKPAYGGSPLFVAKDDSGNRQPITAAPVLGANKLVPNSTMVYFGTGRYLSRSDNAIGDTTHSFYALADTGAAISYPGTRRRDVLYEKTIASESSTGRVIGGNHDTSFWENRKGWYLDFEPPSGDGVGERVVSKPLLEYDRLIFPTLITSNDPCASGATGWLMELVAVGDLYDEWSFLGLDGEPLDAAILALSGLLTSGGKGVLGTNDTDGEPNTHQNDLPADAVGRMSWRQLR